MAFYKEEADTIFSTSMPMEFEDELRALKDENGNPLFTEKELEFYSPHHDDFDDYEGYEDWEDDWGDDSDFDDPFLWNDPREERIEEE